MTLTRNQLIHRMARDDIKLPNLDRKIVNKDLEDAIGDAFMVEKYRDDPIRMQHCRMRRACPPQKAYRYDKLSDDVKETIWDDDDWVAEEKFNGWSMILTYIPGDGFAFWGGNISDIDLLPVDYTEHIVLKNYTSSYYKHESCSIENPMKDSFKVPFILVTEAVCYDETTNFDGMIATNTLDAVKNILSCDSKLALDKQLIDATIIFQCYDFIAVKDIALPLHIRKMATAAVVKELSRCDNFKFVRGVTKDKKQLLNKLWSDGKEGCILKNKYQPYVPGSRLKTHAIKVKRTMSGEIGDDLDCFIGGIRLTKEWSKKNLVGALVLYVVIGDGEFHEIAVVSAMPDSVREEISRCVNGVISLKPGYNKRVVVVDGQELSARNTKIMHAKVDWSRGFRADKSWRDCKFSMENIETERF